MKRKVLMIYTGGTIGMEKDYATGSLKAFDFSGIAAKIPEMDLLECQVSLEQFPEPLDSSDVGPDHWRQLARIIADNYDEYSGFVILHGTDTMAYTASALSFMLKGLCKPVILTGSQLPIGDLRTDAKENLLTGLYYASYYEDDEAVIQEVALYFEYKLLRGNRSMKASAEYFDAFKSPNYPHLGQSGVHLDVDRPVLYRAPHEENFGIDLHLSDEVFLLRIFPGMKLNYLVSFARGSGIKVLILQVYGTGTIFSDANTESILQSVRKLGVEIVVISQCTSGEISFGKYSNSNIFNRIGAISGKDLTVESALAKCMHLIGNPNYPGSFRESFAQNLRGEMS